MVSDSVELNLYACYSEVECLLELFGTGCLGSHSHIVVQHADYIVVVLELEEFFQY